MLMPSRKMYSLSEAAALVGCSVEDLLRNEELNKFKIFVSVPDELHVYSTNKSLLDLVDPSVNWKSRLIARSNVSNEFMEPSPNKDVNLLALAPGDCASIASYGTVNQDRFNQGAFVKDGNDPLIIKPDPIGSIGTFDHAMFRMFVCYAPWLSSEHLSKHPPKKIKLSTDILQVIHADLKLIGLLPDTNVREIRFNIKFTENPHVSTKLIALFEGAKHFWDCSRPGWSEPSPAEVKTWFAQKRGFSKKLAEGAANILRQSFRNWDQDEYDKMHKAFEKGGPVANLFDGIVAIAEESWKNADIEPRGNETQADKCPRKHEDEVGTYPKKNLQINKLLDKTGCPRYLANAGWTIATPDNARIKGRPKNDDE